MGSGKLLSRAILKYGKQNFKKEVLFILNNEDEMNAKEKELVVIDETTYNLCPGGQGGFGYINHNGLRTPVEVMNVARRARLKEDEAFRNNFNAKLAKANKLSHQNRDSYEKFQQAGVEAARQANKEKIYITTPERDRCIKINPKELEAFIARGYTKGRNIIKEGKL